jgi:hypothetical protein
VKSGDIPKGNRLKRFLPVSEPKSTALKRRC